MACPCLTRPLCACRLANHALSQSSNGGDTWSPARLLPIIGTTCQGGIGHVARAKPGLLLLSAPSFPSGGLGGACVSFSCRVS